MTLVQPVQQTIGHGIGASKAAACLGISPYQQPIGAWLELTGRAIGTSHPAAEWGHILEPVVRGYYAARHGLIGDRSIAVPTESVYHGEHPWLRCTPDGYCADDAGEYLVQIKTVDARLRWQWGTKGREEPPPHYRIQAVVEMAVTSLDRVDFAVLCGGNDYFECTVHRDLDLERMVLDRLVEFWHLVETDTPPEVDHSDAWRTYFADRLPTKRKAIDAPAKVIAELATWKSLAAQEEQSVTQIERSRNLILAAAVEHGVNMFTTDDGPVLIVQPKGRRPYVKAPVKWGHGDSE